MADFKPIETQEELDGIIKDRLARNTKSVTDEVTKKFEGFMSPDDYSKKEKEYTDRINVLTSQNTEKDNSIAELTAKNKAYETASVKAKIAHEKGIPFELAGKLAGETEEDIRADADVLAKFITQQKPDQPMRSTEGNAGGKDSALSATLDKLSY